MNILRSAYLNNTPELSRPEAARIVGVSRLTMQRWENWLTGASGPKVDKHRPTLAHQKALKKAFGVDPKVWQQPPAKQ